MCFCYNKNGLVVVSIQLCIVHIFNNILCFVRIINNILCKTMSYAALW